MLQIDNGVVFRDLGAIPRLLQLMNASGDEQLQTEATLTLGAALSRYCCREDCIISLLLCIGVVISPLPVFTPEGTIGLPSVRPSVCLSVRPSVCQSVCLSVCLSVR